MRPVRLQLGGFSLIEVLTVISIVGVLMALLLPAIQSARETSRRIECVNHSRQLGLALQNYCGITGGFPPGYAAGKPAWWGPGWSWSSLLLPHLEQQALADQLAISTVPFGNGAEFAEPSDLARIHLKVFTCPSDTGPRLNELKSGFAKSNYRSITGNRTSLEVSYERLANQNGLFFLNSHVTFSQIRDGSSNTLALGECELDPWRTARRAAIWAGMRGRYEQIVYISDAMWWLNDEPEYRVNGTAVQAFSSNHPGGVVFLFADGSVRLLAPSIDGTTLERLASRDDGNSIELF